MTDTKRIETWVWVLIYLGMASIALGISVSRQSAPLGWTMAVAGAALVAAGIVLIYLRSRIEDNKTETP